MDARFGDAQVVRDRARPAMGSGRKLSADNSTKAVNLDLSQRTSCGTLN